MSKKAEFIQAVANISSQWSGVLAQMEELERIYQANGYEQVGENPDPLATQEVTDLFPDLDVADIHTVMSVVSWMATQLGTAGRREAFDRVRDPRLI